MEQVEHGVFGLARLISGWCIDVHATPLLLQDFGGIPERLVTGQSAARRQGSREWPPGKPDEWRRWFLGRQLFHLFELLLRLPLVSYRTPQPAQTVMRIRLGGIDPDGLAQTAGGFAGFVSGGQKDTKIQLSKPGVGIRRQ